MKWGSPRVQPSQGQSILGRHTPGILFWGNPEPRSLIKSIPRLGSGKRSPSTVFHPQHRPKKKKIIPKRYTCSTSQKQSRGPEAHSQKGCLGYIPSGQESKQTKLRVTEGLPCMYDVSSEHLFQTPHITLQPSLLTLENESSGRERPHPSQHSTQYHRRAGLNP